MSSPNAMAALAPVVERLTAAFSNTVHVDLTSEVSAVHDITSLCPAAFVHLGGLQRLDALNEAAMVRCLQEVVVVVCVVRRDELPVEAVSDPIVAQVFAQLNGWRHPGSYQPMRWLEALDPYFEAGYAEFPHVFAYPVTLGGRT